MSDYDLMRKSDNCEEDCAEEEDAPTSAKEKYFEFYDDVKLTPKDDW